MSQEVFFERQSNYARDYIDYSVISISAISCECDYCLVMLLISWDYCDL